MQECLCNPTGFATLICRLAFRISESGTKTKDKEAADREVLEGSPT
jgi:hypothetical protein